MGKGDRKTKRGKLFSGSYGVTRPRKKVDTPVIKAAAPKKASKKKKDA